MEERWGQGGTGTGIRWDGDRDRNGGEIGMGWNGDRRRMRQG